MGIAVTRAAAVVDDELILEPGYPRRFPVQAPELIAMLTGLPSVDPPGRTWSLGIVIGTGHKQRAVVLSIEGLTATEYARSHKEPVSIYSLRGPTPALDGD